MLQSLWSEILGLLILFVFPFVTQDTGIAVDDSTMFFNSGGTSLLSMQLIQKLQSLFGPSIVNPAYKFIFTHNFGTFKKKLYLCIDNLL